MRKQNIGIIIIVLIIIGVLSFFLYSNYADEQDRINFNKTIKTASDLENVTDKNYVAIYDKGSMSVDEVIAFEKNDIENLTREIDLLNKFKNQTRNSTYKDYLEIEVNRLTYEKRAQESCLESYNLYKEYLNGDMSSSAYFSRQKDIDSQINRTSNQGDVEKTNAINYLEKHPHLNKTLTDLEIDEDFSTIEWGGTGNKNSRLYIY